MTEELLKRHEGFDPQTVAVGDVILRALAGVIEMPLLVEKVDDTLIYAKGGWTFDRVTGCEVDEEIGWGQMPDGTWYTGSYLIGKEEAS